MKILVTGSNGQLGSEIRKLSSARKGHQFLFIDIGDLDLTDFTATTMFLENWHPGIIIHCAAYTDVNKSEQQKELAQKMNGDLPGLIGDYCKRSGAVMIHISTDYVFDGMGHKPYSEEDLTGPQGHYGITKLDGERKVLASGASGIIVRTSWLYSSFGNNFVKTIYSKAKNSPQLKVVFDQVGTPTYAHDLAKTLLDIRPGIQKKKGMEIYHYSNEGAISWYDFAKAIAEMAGITDCEILPVETKDYPTPTRRPYFSVLNKSKIKKDFAIEIPYWKDSLKKCMALISV